MEKENSSRRRDKDHHHRSKHRDVNDRREGSVDRDSRREKSYERGREDSLERKKRKQTDKRTKAAEENGRKRPRFEDVRVKEDDVQAKRGSSLEPQDAETGLIAHVTNYSSPFSVIIIFSIFIGM